MTLLPITMSLGNLAHFILGDDVPWGGLQFSSRHQPLRRGQGVREGGGGGGGSNNFLHFGGIFEFPISF